MPGEASLEDQRLLSLVSTLIIKQGALRESERSIPYPRSEHWCSDKALFDATRGYKLQEK